MIVIQLAGSSGSFTQSDRDRDHLVGSMDHGKHRVIVKMIHFRIIFSDRENVPPYGGYSKWITGDVPRNEEGAFATRPPLPHSDTRTPRE